MKIDALIERDRGVGASALPLTSIHRSAWKSNSPKFAASRSDRARPPAGERELASRAIIGSAKARALGGCLMVSDRPGAKAAPDGSRAQPRG